MDGQPGWVQVGTLADLDDDRLMADGPDGEQVLIVRHGGRLYAIDAMCPHQFAPLIGGDIEDCVLTCVLHGWRFDLRTGQDPDGRYAGVRTFCVRVLGEAIWVGLQGPVATEEASDGDSQVDDGTGGPAGRGEQGA